jgi:hypothetical protein
VRSHPTAQREELDLPAQLSRPRQGVGQLEGVGDQRETRVECTFKYQHADSHMHCVPDQSEGFHGFPFREIQVIVASTGYAPLLDMMST